MKMMGVYQSSQKNFNVYGQADLTTPEAEKKRAFFSLHKFT